MKFPSSPKLSTADMKDARGAQIAIRLRDKDLVLLRQAAKKYGVGHTTLCRTVIEKWIASNMER